MKIKICKHTATSPPNTHTSWQAIKRFNANYKESFHWCWHSLLSLPAISLFQSCFFMAPLIWAKGVCSVPQIAGVTSLPLKQAAVFFGLTPQWMNEWMAFSYTMQKKTTFETWNNHIVCVHYASTTQYTLALQKMYCICALVWMGTIHAFVWKAATQFEQDHTELSARASHSYLNCSPVTRTSAMRSSSAAFFCIVFPIPSISLQLLK